MYFTNFPRTLYLVSPPKRREKPEYVSLTDITVNVRFKKEILDKITLYDIYLIKEGDTMEVTSERLYGSPYYHWVLMLLNDMYDWKNDFPLDSYEFDRAIIDKYGSIETAKSTISFYRNENGYVVDSDYINPATGLLDAEPIYAYDHELALNEEKRRIKIISPELLTVVLNNFRSLV